MKQGIHPKYKEVDVRCACGATWKTRSTKDELRLEICSQCHPFFTGRQKLIDTEGRVERFTKKFGVQTSEARKAAEKAKRPPPRAAPPNQPLRRRSRRLPRPAAPSLRNGKCRTQASARVLHLACTRSDPHGAGASALCAVYPFFPFFAHSRIRATSAAGICRYSRNCW